MAKEGMAWHGVVDPMNIRKNLYDIIRATWKTRMQPYNMVIYVRT